MFPQEIATADASTCAAPDDLLLATLASKRVNTAGNEGPGCWEDDGAQDDDRLREALELFPSARPR